MLLYVHVVATAAENRLLACRQRGLFQTLPVPWCAGDCMYSAAPLADGVLSHLDAVSWAVQETRAKSRRGSHGMRTTSQHTPFNPHKPAGTVMKSTFLRSTSCHFSSCSDVLPTLYYLRQVVLEVTDTVQSLVILLVMVLHPLFNESTWTGTAEHVSLYLALHATESTLCLLAKLTQPWYIICSPEIPFIPFY